MNSISITQKDKGYNILFTVRNSSGDIIDLVTVTEARFKVVRVDDYRNVIDKLATVLTPTTNGKIQYTVDANDFIDAGNFEGALHLKFGLAKELTTDPFFISVNRSFA